MIFLIFIFSLFSIVPNLRLRKLIKNWGYNFLLTYPEMLFLFLLTLIIIRLRASMYMELLAQLMNKVCKKVVHSTLLKKNFFL